VQTCIWPGGCNCHSLSLASVKSRLVLPFWYRITRVVLDKEPLNGCACVCVCVTYLHSLRTCRCAGDLGAGERARVTWYVGHTAVSLARQPAAHHHIPPSPTSRRHHLPHQPQLRECRTTTWILDYRRIIPDLINYRNW